ncbi:MAG: hypothetical protein ACM31C_27855 [Acidobacteriota bacterium]
MDRCQPAASRRRDPRKFLVIARGSALECAASFDAMVALGSNQPLIAESDALVVRIVSMPTKMIR